ncbi:MULTISPECIES: hypothetical protein [Thermococcus]|uniref:Uncharacterized protein n=1 Tax=Thermococcus nautili TaxID=195522 RepID=W8P237_9EURY|nr:MULTISPECIES: hypothetical protein [Thermococcus]AHL22821.1 hypothetical protein BD01_1206 [Thermococcus nautili]NJE50053.1 hypothetical protein [Thermococcus sp. 9N3]CAI1492897.1 conserved membrane protein of unknown function [Thermococcus nautili]
MMEMLLDVAIILLAMALVGVSYLAYRKSHLRATLYLALAFLLFAFKKVVEISAESRALGRDIGLIVDFLEVLVLLLFFLALWRR